MRGKLIPTLLVVLVVLLYFMLYFLLNVKKQIQVKESTISTSTCSHTDFEKDFKQRITEPLPLETVIEKEYFGKGIVLTGLHPYSVVNILNPCDVSRYGYDTLVPLQMTPSELSSFFFSKTFLEKEASKQFTDYRSDKDLYGIERINGRKSLKTKISNLKVHALFNHQLEYRDDFLGYPLSTERSKREYCVSDGLCGGPNSNTPNMCVVCDAGKDKQKSNFFYKEWCSLPNIDLAIVSINDGILDYGTTHPEARFNIYDRLGNIFTLSRHNMRFHRGGNWGIEYHPMLATIGTTYYPGAFGHFPIEILPRILFLHRFVPLHIPIIIFDHQFVRNIVDELFQYNILHRERKIVWARPNTYYVASRLYFIHSKSEIATPLTPDLVLRIASNMMKQPYLQGIVPNPYKSLEPYILVVDRSDSGSRMLDNNLEMVKAVETISSKQGIRVLNLKLSTIPSFFQIGQVFHRAVGIIAPHGAGLANINVANKAVKFIIEIGWKGFPGNFAWPGDYYCQARGLGLKYYSVTSTYGHYYSRSMGVSIDEITSIVQQELSK